MLPAPRRLQYLHGVLASALAHAVREDLLPRNVARQVQVPSGPPRRHEPLTPAEAGAFLSAAHEFPDGDIYELALRLGLRRGELLGLRWSDIDFATRTLTIRRTLQRVKGHGLTEMPTKTRSSDRRIPLTLPCVRILKDRKRRQRSQAGRAWAESGYVFTSSTGRPVSPQRVSENVKALCKRAGIRAIRLHDLRHSCATLLIEAGVALVTVRDLLGHSSITITANTYTHTRLPHQADSLRLLDRLLDQPQPKRRRPSETALA
jgi:integrase